MSGVGKLSSPVSLWLCAALLVSAAAFPFGRWAATGKTTAAVPDMDGWDVPRLNQHLASQGLSLRLVATSESHDASHNAFLTWTGKGRQELSILPKQREWIERWKGTVYCEWLNSPASRELQLDLWDDCGWSVGPFVFFGDRELLAAIRACLTGNAPLPTPVAHAVAE
jgi:hypothetical protein